MAWVPRPAPTDAPAPPAGASPCCRWTDLLAALYELDPFGDAKTKTRGQRRELVRTAVETGPAGPVDVVPTAALVGSLVSLMTTPASTGGEGGTARPTTGPRSAPSLPQGADAPDPCDEAPRAFLVLDTNGVSGVHLGGEKARKDAERHAWVIGGVVATLPLTYVAPRWGEPR